MAKLYSSNIAEEIAAAGIAYLPADQIYYSKFMYKVELSPVFKGLGLTRQSTCRIDITDPAKARQRLEEFVDTTTNKILNAEKRLDILSWVDRLPDVEYKRRVGGENSIFYFRSADSVLALCKEFPSLINSVTGPISKSHQEAFNNDCNTVMRETLYYKRFRYRITLTCSHEFYEQCGNNLIKWLNSVDNTRWKSQRLRLMQDHLASRAANPRLAVHLSRARNSKVSNPITLFLEHPEDFVYVKLITGGYAIQTQEVVLFSELT
jgi:hypothetical protein